MKVEAAPFGEACWPTVSAETTRVNASNTEGEPRIILIEANRIESVGGRHAAANERRCSGPRDDGASKAPETPVQTDCDS